MTTRRLAAAAACAATALTLAGCGSGGTGGTGETPETGGTSTGEAAALTMWVNGTDIPQDLRDYLVETFEAEHPGSTLEIEEQDWNGLVPRLQTALASEEQTPDVVEIGNTQSPTFTYAGAFADITDLYDELGGDDLLEGFVQAGSADGGFFAAPFYSGARAVFYNKDHFAAAGVEVPTTLGELTEVATTLQANPPAGVADYSGFWFPGQDWYNGAAWIYAHGGELATPTDDGWAGALSSPESLEGLTEVQTLFTSATSAPRDADSDEPWIPFNNGQAAMFSAPTWARWSIDLPQCHQDVEADDTSEAANALRAEQQACNEEHTGVFALPSVDGDGVAPVFAGGSNIAVAANSQHPELARDVLRIIFGDEFQGMLGSKGLIPGNSTFASSLGDDVYSQVAIAAALEAKLTPPAEKWADVEGDRILEDFFQKIASGADLEQTAADTDRLLTDTLG